MRKVELKNMKLSRRQIDCLIIKYKETGKFCFVHNNHTRKLAIL